MRRMLAIARVPEGVNRKTADERQSGTAPSPVGAQAAGGQAEQPVRRHGATAAPIRLDCGHGHAVMKSRTKGVAGLARMSWGLPICSIRPIDITTTRSASSIASSWSWVTKTVVSPVVS